MKGSITLGIYVAIGITGAAIGQESIHPKNEPMSVQTIRMPPATIPPGWTGGLLGTAAPIIAPPSNNPLRVPIVIKHGAGGRVDEHRQTFSSYQRAKAKVEVRGPCYSACTLVLAYVEPENLCIASGGFMAFHAIRSGEYGEIMVGATHEFVASMPLPIQRWIRDNGGWQNLPLHSYWTLYDRQLWAFGYPKCP